MTCDEPHTISVPKEKIEKMPELKVIFKIIYN